MFEKDIVKLKGVLAQREYEKAGYQLTQIILKAYEMRNLKSRIWLYVAKVIFDKEVRTAQINLKTGFISFGTDFFIKHMNSIEDLLFLMLHERNHFIMEHSIWLPDLIHLRRSLPLPIVMLVEDAFINATAYRTAPSDISDRFYDHKTLTVILTSDNKGVRKIYQDKEIVKIHSQMWNPEKYLPDFGEFARLLIKWFREKMQQEKEHHQQQAQSAGGESQGAASEGEDKNRQEDDSGQGSGSSSENSGQESETADGEEEDSRDSEGDEEELDEDACGDSPGKENKNEGEGGDNELETLKSETEKQAEAITPIVEGQRRERKSVLNQEQAGSVAYSEKGDKMVGRKIITTAPKSDIQKALSTLTQVEIDQFNLEPSLDTTRLDKFISDFQCLRFGQEGLQGYTSTVPHRISKRDLNVIQSGEAPVTWAVTYEGLEKQTKLYMDVSGSMGSYLGLIPYLFSHLMEHVDEVFEFSTVIVRVDPQDTNYYTTSGTSFDVVAGHILEKEFQSVIIITDGCGGLSERLAERLRYQLEHCVYIKIGPDNRFTGKSWEKVADQVIHLEP